MLPHVINPQICGLELVGCVVFWSCDVVLMCCWGCVGCLKPTRVHFHVNLQICRQVLVVPEARVARKKVEVTKRPWSPHAANPQRHLHRHHFHLEEYQVQYSSYKSVFTQLNVEFFDQKSSNSTYVIQLVRPNPIQKDVIRTRKQILHIYFTGFTIFRCWGATMQQDAIVTLSPSITADNIVGLDSPFLLRRVEG